MRISAAPHRAKITHRPSSITSPIAITSENIRGKSDGGIPRGSLWWTSIFLSVGTKRSVLNWGHQLSWYMCQCWNGKKHLCYRERESHICKVIPFQSSQQTMWRESSQNNCEETSQNNCEERAVKTIVKKSLVKTIMKRGQSKQLWKETSQNSCVKRGVQKLLLSHEEGWSSIFVCIELLNAWRI